MACLLKVSQKKCAAHLEAIGNVALKLLPHRNFLRLLGHKLKAACHSAHYITVTVMLPMRACTLPHTQTHTHTRSCFLFCILFLSRTTFNN